MNNSAANIRSFELALLFLLVFVAVYFVYLAVRDFKMSKNIRLLNWKVRDLIAGNYSDSILIQGDADLVELGESLNDLSDVFRMAHDNLEQEKNRLASILTYMTDGVLATDRSGKIVMINETAQQQFNLAYDEALSMNIVDMLGSGSPYSFQDLVSKTPEVVLNRRDENGEFVTLRIRFALNRRESGFISGLVAVSHDATEQEKEERERRLFVSNVSHEFKTPINAIEGYTMLLQGEELSPDQEEYVEKILFNTQRLSGLVGNILLLSKLENQNIPMKKTEYRLDEQIRQAFLSLETKWTEKEIGFQVELEEVKYTGNEGLFMHIWINLLDNAIKFSPSKGTITMFLKQEQDSVKFILEDEGPGIEDDVKSRIFDKFYQVDGSHKAEGNGLGLALVKRIVDSAGGTIKAENREYGGCRFVIELPKQKDEII